MFGHKGVKERLRELEERVANLKRLVESRDLDWVDMRSRCKRLLDRTEKAAARIAEDVVESPSDQSTHTNGEAAVMHGRSLSAHQIEVQQSILKRRAGL